MAVSFNPASFREQFPAFADSVRFPDSVLSRCFTQSTCYINNETNRCINAQCLELLLYSFTAHICLINSNVQQDKTNGIVTSASVGGVSVGLAPPPFGSDQWSWWINTTPYGQQVEALLDGLSAGGFYFGGRCERGAFRKVGGGF